MQKIWLLFLVVFLVACHPPDALDGSARTWLYQDVRHLDTAGDVANPELDLIALYNRKMEDGVQLRLDFLDSAPQPSYDLYLAFDFLPGGETTLPFPTEAQFAWEWLLFLPAQGQLSLRQAASAPALISWSVMRDPEQDELSLRLRTSDAIHLPRAAIIVYTTLPGSEQMADVCGPALLNAAPPAPAQVHLLFSQALRSSTPAELLRSWDGAHSGPASARHGLRYLLEAIEANQIPATILDLKSPSNLAGLSYLQQFERVAFLEQQQLLTLPDVELQTQVEQPVFQLPAPAYLYARRIYQRTLTGFGLSSYAIDTDWPITALPFQVLEQGELSLEVRRALLNQALMTPDQISVIHSMYTGTDWGVPGVAARALGYLRHHPWIKVLPVNRHLPSADLPQAQPPLKELRLNAPDGQALVSGLNAAQMHDHVFSALQAAPNNPASQAAWEMYLSLVQADSQMQHELRAQVLGQVGHLLAAADWAAVPYTVANCERDLDFDGEKECILASARTFASFENHSGALVVAFVIQNQQLHQWIAPLYQVKTAWSDTFLWKPELGLAADPAQLPGAFSFSALRWANCIPAANSDRLQLDFDCPAHAARKTYSLTDEGYRVEIHSQRAQMILLPLSADPWQRFQPDWIQSYPASDLSENEWRWTRPDGLRFTVQFSRGEWRATWFNQSQSQMTLPEDPNLDYGRGHLLPFPFAWLEWNGSGTLAVELKIDVPMGK